MTGRQLAVMVLVCGALVMQVQIASSPARQAPRAVPGSEPDRDLAQQAVVRRDRYGVPHILAETEEAAAFAHGYVTAEDHGALMARAFLRARGSLASVFGPGFVQGDVRAHTLRIHEVAEERFDELPPHMQWILNGYAAGYNRFLAERRSELPEWATPATGIDVLAVCRAIVLLDFSLDPRPWGAQPISAASNMWMIGGSRTASGRPMLLANPHLGWEEPSTLWHEVQITVPGVINISGATFIGLPVVSIGFNESLGWTHTVNQFDAEDLYELTLDESGTRYAYEGHWLPLKSRPFTIDVRREDGSTRSEQHTAWWSHQGPIARMEGRKAYAVKAPSLDIVQFVTQYNAMAKATSFSSFLAAVSMHQLPMFNIGYADKAGNIWYLFDARIPVRPPGFQWSGIVPGNTTKTEWFTIWPIPELPQQLNPASGYLQNCNNAPWYSNLQDRIDRAKFKGYLDVDGNNLRSQFSLRTLDAEKSMTPAKLMAYKYNDDSLLAERLKPELLAKVRSLGDEWRAAADLLEKWDNTTHDTSRGAVLFMAWWEEYTRGLNRVPYRQPWTPAEPMTTPLGIADMDRAVEAFKRAATLVKSRAGALDVAWGDIHRLRRGDLDLPADGAAGTFSNASFRPAPDGRRVLNAGDTYTLVVEFGETPLAYSILPYSESSNSSSPYFNNQLQLYADKQFKRAWFTEADIAANVARQYRPAKSTNH